MEGFKYLINDCQAEGTCTTCQEPAKQRADGRWFITIGHPGFNSPANNRGGYPTKQAAVKAYKRYASK